MKDVTGSHFTICSDSCSIRTDSDPCTAKGYQPKWRREAIDSQGYPRSFKDSNDDSIGNLKGVTSKGRGVNVIWMSPHYDSPTADDGYNIRDYRKVMFGAMAEFDELKGIKAIPEFVYPLLGGARLPGVHTQAAKKNR